MKRFFKHICITTVVFNFLISFFPAKGEKRYAEDVFKKWLDIQYILADVDLREMRHLVGKDNVNDLRERYQTNVRYLKTLIKFYNLDSNQHLEDIFFERDLPTNIDLIERFCTLYDLMETDFVWFVDDLIENGFAKGASNSEEDKIGVDILFSKYSIIPQIMFLQDDFYKLYKFMFAVGNRFFEFCFYDETFPTYKHLLMTKTLHPMVRFLHTIIWQYLVSFGWKWWHQNCLDEIKKRCDAGAQLIYVAGGSDIYHPIKHGIYNIKIVDPFLPSQERYYAQGWQWLADGKIGDEIEFVFDDKTIVLRRAEYKLISRMFPTLSTGQVVELPQSKTVWNVYDESVKKKKLLGRVVFDRRFCQQSDFVSGPDKVVVMSTTEMISSIDIEKNKGWGIDAYQLDNNFEMFVKQMRKPISAQVLRNIRFACENQKHLEYIFLTSDPT